MTEATDWGIVVALGRSPATVEDSIATLRDGVAVTLRRLADTDLDSVVALADYLSDDERYLRFFTVHPCGMAEWAQSLTKPAPDSSPSAPSTTVNWSGWRTTCLPTSPGRPKSLF
jgi:hypothetical protein